MTFFFFSRTKQFTLAMVVYFALFSILLGANLKKQNYKISQELLDRLPQVPLHIKMISYNVEPGLNFLSTDPNGTYVNLFNKDDNSGRQKWIVKVDKNADGIKDRDVICAKATVEVSGGYNQDQRKYLSTDGGVAVDLWNKIDSPNNQYWYFCPHGSYFNIINLRKDKSRGYLSTNYSGQVDLYEREDGTGRQRWLVFQA